VAFRFLTAGESHGPALSVTLDGIPAGVGISGDAIAADLERRQRGYGRGARMKIEQDRAEILAGVRLGRTLGSPVLLLIRNRDWENWTRVMQVEAPTAREAADLAALVAEGDKKAQPVTRLRPGHADLAGALKYGFDDVRNVLERASARETTARVAAGAVCRAFLRELGIDVWSFTAEVGGVAFDPERATRTRAETDESPLRCPDPRAEEQMIAAVDEARRAGDTVGGVFEVVATGVPVGVGSYVQWDRRLDGALARAICSIQSVKGVEFGLGFEQTRRRGSEVHDVIAGIGDASPGSDAGGRDMSSGIDGLPVRRWLHITNRAGGLTGGVSTGEPIIVRGAVKPISTLARALPSADLRTGEPVELAHYERSDVSVVPAAGVIGEAMVLLTLTEHVIEKFGGDALADVKDSVSRYLERTVRVGAAAITGPAEGGEAGSGGDD
jgi:chorismate synthase